MLKLSSRYRYIFCFSVIFVFSVRSLSIEELKSVNYEVELLKVPVKRDEEPMLPSVRMKTVYGQEYQCYLPLVNDEENPEKEPVGENNNVRELLVSLQNEPCLMKSKDWWTYEFCFGQFIKQFHIEDGKILGQVLTLGIYESDYDWNNETNNEDMKKNTKPRYHSQYFVNGTKCDLTGQSRTTEVRFFCEEGVGDYIYRVDEPGTCSYIITIHTSRLCSHPLLKPPPSKKANSIPCHPVVTDEQYEKYLLKLAEEKELAERKRIIWLNKQQEKLQVMKHENLLKESESKPSIPTEKEAIKDIPIKDTPIKDIPIKETNDKSTSSAPPEGAGEKKVLPKSDLKTLAKNIGFGTPEEMDRIMKNLKYLPEKVSKLRNIIKDIFAISEADADASPMWSKGANQESNNKIMETLKKSLEKLEKTESELAKASESIVKKELKLELLRKEIEEAQKEEVEEEEEEEEDDIVDDSFITRAKDDKESVLDDNEVTVRIRKLDHRKPDSAGRKYLIDSEQKEKLEQVVKERLAKAGLDTGGRKIEVKIITGYYDNDVEGLEDVHSLTDDESSQFQNMIMALLWGQKEAMQEMERHKKLEDNYKMLWDENEEETE